MEGNERLSTIYIRGMDELTTAGHMSEEKGKSLK